jgi:hypothetical protein
MQTESTQSISNTEQIRVKIYEHFATTGREPTVSDLASRAGVDPDVITDALAKLHDQRHIVLSSTIGNHIVLAHPFASESFGFSVMGAKVLWWGGCAWDAFAIPHLVDGEPDVLVATRCPGCDSAMSWVVRREEPPTSQSVAHFLTPMSEVWNDVEHACSNQRIFCSEKCVDAWLDRTDNAGGYVLDLATLWRLASNWYAGRLDAGYVRREPTEAATYFAEVGLKGSFWGLP